MHCIKCGSKIPDGENVCKVCGMDLSMLDEIRKSLVDNQPEAKSQDNLERRLEKCPKCGTVLKDGAAFCTRCGFKTREADKEKTAVTGKGMNSSDKTVIFIAACGMLVLIALVLITCNFGILNKPAQPNNTPEMAVAVVETNAPKQEEVQTEALTPNMTPEPVSRGTSQPIPDNIREFMLGRSMTPNDIIGFDDLSYLSIPYIDFNGEYQIGHMVVAVDLAEEVLDIFEELYNIEYPIERMELVDYFFDKQTEILDSPDRASMGNNNTSSFYYRVVSGTTNLSNHARGRAIDLNTKVNPYVTPNGSVSPRNAEKYADRSCEGWTDVEKRAFIGPDTEVYRIFTSRGWQWGGEIWEEKDYQHFQKP